MSLAKHKSLETLGNEAQWLPIEALRPWERNPRRNDAAVPKVAASIRRFGFVAPIVVWKGGDRIVAGDTRLKAMRAILREDPSFVARGAPGPGLVRVVFHEFVSEAEANAYALADNKLHELSDWDENLLKGILTELDEPLAQIAGWEDAELKALLESEEPSTEPESPATSDSSEAPRVLGAWDIVHGDVRDVLKRYPDNHFDALLSDPPYGLAEGKTRTWDEIDEGAAKGGFMGKAWDCAVPGLSFWREVLRVLKPGAPLIAFFGTRTYHRGVVAIEDAGFEIRDCIAWLYGSGFPKSLDVSKAIDDAAGADRKVIGRGHRKATGRMAQGAGGYAFGEDYEISEPTTDLARMWNGYGTALKPGHEPAVLARKPLDGTVAENIAKWGVGGLAVDACRVGENGVGRWPANVILDRAAGAVLDAQTGNRPSTPFRENVAKGSVLPIGGYDDDGGASRFFYCPKPSRREREAGLHRLPLQRIRTLSGEFADGNFTKYARNVHPTVKPIALARYLATMLLPPKRDGDTRKLLVPFSGSGSEAIGALLAGWDDVIGIEREADYVELARARIRYAVAHPDEFDVADEDDDDAHDEMSDAQFVEA